MIVILRFSRTVVAEYISAQDLELIQHTYVCIYAIRSELD